MVNKEGPYYFIATFYNGGESDHDWVSVLVPIAGLYYSGELSPDSDIVVHVPE